MTSAVAVVFPGQGAQVPGMGLELARAYPHTAGRVFEVADRVLGFRLSRIIAVGDASLLAQTEVTQPALLAASLVAWRALRAELPRLVPASAAGLSLGEYSALASAGALDLADAFRLVSARGRLTDSAARRRPGSMSAILGLTRDKVESICASLASAMWARGVRIFVELGPGKTLAGLIARIIPEATTLGVSDLATLSQAVAVLDAYALEAVS